MFSELDSLSIVSYRHDVTGNVYAEDFRMLKVAMIVVRYQTFHLWFGGSFNVDISYFCYITDIVTPVSCYVTMYCYIILTLGPNAFALISQNIAILYNFTPPENKNISGHMANYYVCISICL